MKRQQSAVSSEQSAVTARADAEPPLIGGGQGRTPEEVEAMVRAALPVLAVLAAVLILCALHGCVVRWSVGSVATQPSNHLTTELRSGA